MFDLGLAFFAGVLFAEGIRYGVEATNTNEFCTSCHSMQISLKEYEESLHFKNVIGIQTNCADCHIPKSHISAITAKVFAVQELMAEMYGTIDTPEKFEARRWTLANQVWAKMKASDSQECRICHSILNMVLSEQFSLAARRHATAKEDGKTCIDCHKGVVHRKPKKSNAN
ncbi:NapC/NirT family cytochrome c [Thiobaca trueperi]|uniref:Cytochrome c-type protein n=1 Tax=Thiobaca trueperi TaxID=127458 RepID=A0A4R3MSE0_9GAMM|nr:NapC/NirT family cytochrome c [Thiobaca trueperi]TCT19174.1 periplasmic nitrate reductase subunit NapC [Thiobaca trueperi]